MAKIYARHSFQFDGNDVIIELRLDDDGAYRWYEADSGLDTEVSGEDIEGAFEGAFDAWGVDEIDYVK